MSLVDLIRFWVFVEDFSITCPQVGSTVVNIVEVWIGSSRSVIPIVSHVCVQLCLKGELLHCIR
jgi:hypothetical protein